MDIGATLHIHKRIKLINNNEYKIAEVANELLTYELCRLQTPQLVSDGAFRNPQQWHHHLAFSDICFNVNLNNCTIGTTPWRNQQIFGVCDQ
jgi:hypothetical protein